MSRPNVRIAGLQWDAGNWPKCGKHGVSKRDIEGVIARHRYLIDDPHLGEARFRCVGTSDEGRYITVVFTLREGSVGTFVRPISARFMHAKEVEAYERGKPEGSIDLERG